MAPHCSTLAWKIPWMEEPGGLQSMGWLRVGHWVTSISLFTFMHWRRKWQPTPVFLPGESCGQRSLVGYSPWSCKQLDVTEQLSTYTYTYTVFPVAWGKESICNAGDARDLGSIPALGRSPREGNGNPLQYSCLKNPMERGACQATVHAVAESTKHTHMHIYVYKYIWTYICLFTSLFIFFTKIEVLRHYSYLSGSPLYFWHLLQCLVHGWPSLNIFDGKKNYKVFVVLPVRYFGV